MRLAVLAAALLVSSCALFAPTPSPSTTTPAPAPLFGRSPVEELAAYVSRLNAMPEAALAAEAQRQRQAGTRAGDDITRVKAAAAILLAQPAEDAQAIALLEPVEKREGADAQLKAMASFLHAMASDRRRLRESAAAANARLRDERRAHETQRSRADAAAERAAQMHERARELQQKLDALTELEKSLSDRPISSR